jgi:hypothetical protein
MDLKPSGITNWSSLAGIDALFTSFAILSHSVISFFSLLRSSHYWMISWTFVLLSFAAAISYVENNLAYWTVTTLFLATT